MMKVMFSVAMWILISVFLALCFPEEALTDSGAEYSIIKVTLPPKIDGKLDDAIWKYAEPAEIGLTDQGGKVTKMSVAYGVYDDSYLYFAFHRMDKDVGKLEADAKGRDSSVWDDDEFELFIDTNHDHKTYWQLCVNTVNEIFDCENIGANCDSATNADWETAVTVGAKEDWFLEVKIGYQDLDVKEKPKPGDVWGVNFCGHVKSGIDEWVTWSDIGASFHTPAGFGNMTFSSKAASVKPVGALSAFWGKIKESN